MSGNLYRAVFKNTVGSVTSRAAKLTVIEGSAPTITLEPADQTVVAGQSATFEAAAIASPAPRVLWQRSADGGVSYLDVPGSTRTTLTVDHTVIAMSGELYRAVFKNIVGSATSTPAILNVTSPGVPPSITRQPTPQTVAPGQTATFAAAATGTPAPAVQWQRSANGRGSYGDVSGATSTTLVVRNTTVSMSGDLYRAVFKNTAGTDTSSAARLTVSVPPRTSTILAGGDDTCALVSSGTVKCWGYNRYGTVGDGTTVNRPSPTAVSVLSGVVSVSGTVLHVCALLSDTTVDCWGAMSMAV
jgi:hypothetical protein